MKTTAIVLAAGQGKRMGSHVAKQYLLLKDRPVLYYSLKCFEESIIDQIILVTAKGQEAYCKKEIVDRYGFSKVTGIVEGGKERYHSVAKGLDAAGADCDYVFIHDGARPFITPEMIGNGLKEVKKHEACVFGMPVKDTIKLSDEEGFAKTTPKRELVWQIQTPQMFSYPIIKEAYDQLLIKEEELQKQGISITDDAMVAELLLHKKVKLVRGSYENIKLTTPEDLEIAETFLKSINNNKNSSKNLQKNVDTKNQLC